MQGGAKSILGRGNSLCQYPVVGRNALISRKQFNRDGVEQGNQEQRGFYVDSFIKV